MSLSCFPWHVERLITDLLPSYRLWELRSVAVRELVIGCDRPDQAAALNRLCGHWIWICRESFGALMHYDWVRFQLGPQVVLRVRPAWAWQPQRDLPDAVQPWRPAILRATLDQHCALLEFQQRVAPTALSTAICDLLPYGNAIHAMCPHNGEEDWPWPSPSGVCRYSLEATSPRQLPSGYARRRLPWDYMIEFVSILERDGEVRDFYYETFQPEAGVLVWANCQARVVRGWGEDPERPVILTAVAANDWGLILP